MTRVLPSLPRCTARELAAVITAVAGMAALATPGWAGEVASATEIFRSEKAPGKAPRRWDGTVLVPRDVDSNAHIRVSYWRLADKRPDRGKLAIELDVHRDIDGDGTTDEVERLRAGGSVEDHAFVATLGPLAALRAGDWISYDARLVQTPELEPRSRAVLEVVVLDSPSSCPAASDLTGDIAAPVKISYPSPQYTEEARLARIQGVVILESRLDCDGRISQVTILKGLPMGLGQESVEALARWRFEPARRGRYPVAVLYNLTINFQLQIQGGQPQPSVTVEGRMSSRDRGRAGWESRNALPGDPTR